MQSGFTQRFAGAVTSSKVLNDGSGRLAAPATHVVTGGRPFGGIGMFVAFFLRKRELDE
jgi:hypothetical protein